MISIYIFSQLSTTNQRVKTNELKAFLEKKNRYLIYVFAIDDYDLIMCGIAFHKLHSD